MTAVAPPSDAEAFVQRLLAQDDADKRRARIASHGLNPEELRKAIALLDAEAVRILGADPRGMERICADALALAEQAGDDELWATVRMHDGDALRFQDRNAEAQCCYDFFSLSRNPEVLAVAAAGNDSCRPGRLFLPRMPAAVERVLGVSAASAGGTAVTSSNADDIERGRDDGVSAQASVTGLYVADPPAFLSGAANSTGWARWRGTSFSTAIAAGLAACVWSEDPGLLASLPPGVPPRRTLVDLMAGPPASSGGTAPPPIDRYIDLVQG